MIGSNTVQSPGRNVPAWFFTQFQKDSPMLHNGTMTDGKVPFTLTNFRKEDTIQDWPLGSNKRGPCTFTHEANKRGQRILRTTTGKPKASRYYSLVCLADGSDGKTHLVGYCQYGGIAVMSADMQHSDYTLYGDMGDRKELFPVYLAELKRVAGTIGE